MKSNSKLLGVVISLILAGGTVFAFFWLWTQMNADTLSATGPAKYTPIEVSSVKKDAEDILADKQKASDIPLKAVPEKMGKDNPFK